MTKSSDLLFFRAIMVRADRSSNRYYYSRNSIPKCIVPNFPRILRLKDLNKHHVKLKSLQQHPCKRRKQSVMKHTGSYGTPNLQEVKVNPVESHYLNWTTLSRRSASSWLVQMDAWEDNEISNARALAKLFFCVPHCTAHHPVVPQKRRFSSYQGILEHRRNSVGLMNFSGQENLFEVIAIPCYCPRSTLFKYCSTRQHFKDRE